MLLRNSSKVGMERSHLWLEGQMPQSAASKLLFWQVYCSISSAGRDGLRTGVAQGHCVLLEQKKTLQTGF